jgi:transglutaminase-like putative cysteine protease
MTVQRTLTIMLCLLTSAFLYAQDKPPARFGKISPADFDVKAPSYDTAADAVVIADVGSSEFVGNVKGWFTLEFRHFKRIKILNKKAFDAATVEISLFGTSSYGQRLEGLKGYTYNLENGKVVETKLDDKSIFTDKVNKYLSRKKFTFPALKEGSIIEYTYTLQSDFFDNLRPWAFQDIYPCMYSEYDVSLPNFFQYVTLTQGFLPFKRSAPTSRNTTFRVTIPGGADRDENYSFDDEVVETKYTMKDIPSFKQERYTTTIYNYVSKIEFQLSRYAFPNSITKDKMGNWFSLSAGLMKDEDFGADLNNSNGWMDDEMKNITKGATSPLDQARKIYAYIRDNFTCTSHDDLWASNPIKTVFKNRNGNEADLNLLLIAMLKHDHLNADPVILSTRSNGFTNEIYPLRSRFNYVIAKLDIDSVTYYLDASQSWEGFGHLPEYCYNGHARVINPENPMPVYFDADALLEKSITTVFMANEAGKGLLNGRVMSVKSYIESSDIREKVRDKGEKEFFKAIQTAYPGEWEISNSSIDSLKIIDDPVTINYDVQLKADGEDILYFNPMLSEGYKENPFKAAERVYPVEMPYGFDETYVLNMEVPTGYVVDELPKSAKVTFNENEGFFEYLFAKDDNGIQFRSRIQLKKANFKPEDYATLREFFAFIVKKQSEQIVFKKKK